MADTKISALPASTTPLAGTEVLPIVQGGSTVKVSVANLTAGRAISATAVTASTGNFIVGTSGQGIDFSATPGTGTSELLSDYEEGTWTPTVETLTVVGDFSSTGTYTKIGRIVEVRGTVVGSVSIAAGANATFGGLPFAAAPSFGIGMNSAASATASLFVNSTSVMFIQAVAATGLIYFSATYTV